ncbi:MAG: 50S ribosomal protein L9, partial [Alphaproteobacteria bacterium]
MDVILLERIARLGELGDVVSVKAGYARNFLLPQKKALRATNENKEYYEREKTNIEKANEGKRSEAETTAAGLDGQSFVLIRQAGESGHLYGSVSARDIAGAASDKGFAVSRQQVAIDRPIKELGLHEAAIALHPELVV